MNGIFALDRSGPFPQDSQPHWFVHGDVLVRVLDMPGYAAALVEAGAADHEARDIVDRMQTHGATGVLWAGAHGGRRGHIHSTWDVRIAVTTSPAAEAVPAITGAQGRPVGASAVPSLEGREGVLAAYTQVIQPQKIRLPSSKGPNWSRALHLPAQVHYHYRRAAYAALAVETVGVTVNVLTDSLPVAEHALRSLVDIALQDVAASAAPEHSG